MNNLYYCIELEDNAKFLRIIVWKIIKKLDKSSKLENNNKFFLLSYTISIVRPLKTTLVKIEVFQFRISISMCFLKHQTLIDSGDEISCKKL